MATDAKFVSYTQENVYDNSIHGAIAELWKQRDQGYINGVDKKKIYWCSLTHPQHTKAIVMVNGRIESCYKYQELFFDLYRYGYDIYAFDHRGQGLSERLVKDSDIGHVIDFNDYIEDLSLVVKSFPLQRYQNSYLLAHSMGGAIATRYLQLNPQHGFTALALSAPMFGIPLPWYVRPLAILITQVMSAMYPPPKYAPGYGAYYEKPFDDNPLSQSEKRYRWFRQLYAQHPELQVGGPSMRWVWQGLMAGKQCIQLTRQITIPLLLIQAGNDRIVRNEAQNLFIRKLSKTNHQAELCSIADAQHEILFETDHYRNQALDALFQFMEKHT